MRFDLWTLTRFLHVGSAILWVGGQLTLSLIVRPVTTRRLDAATRVDVVSGMGSAFGRMAAVALIPTLLATGLALTYQRGVTYGYLGLPGYGTTLGFKVTFALISFGLAALHGVSAVRDSSRATRAVAIGGGVISVGVVLMAVALVP